MTKRNPLITVNNFKIQTIGDPHLGRQFKTSVPKDKLGLRELQVEKQFLDLLGSDADVIVIMGDLFDKTTVANAVVLFAIEALEQAALQFKDVTYIVLAGNHDLVKDKSKKSSFDILLNYFESSPLDNLHIVVEPFVFYMCPRTSLVLVPYTVFDKKDLPLPHFPDHSYISFGHWDVQDFDQISDTVKYTSNLIPSYIKEASDIIVTGHEHLPKYVKTDKYELYVTGSMQPYAFGEQLDQESLYCVHSLDTVNLNLKKDINFYSSSNLRIICNTDDVLSSSISCLSLSYKFIKEVEVVKDTTTDMSNSSLQPLSFSSLLYQELSVDGDIDLNKYLSDCFMNKTYTDWKQN